MDYDFYRIDYSICGITYPDTLKILPPSANRPEQKFAIGDKNGVLQCLSIKDEEPVVQFKTLPGKPITSVQLAATDDKIFAASGNEVKGYTRKGKVFLTLETSVSETITSMCVLGSDLILCSGRAVTFYRDLRETNCYICEDRVLDIAAFSTPNNTKVRLLVLIANKGAAILENGQLISRITIPSGPSRLAVPPPIHTAEIYAFYGASDGSIGLISHEQSVLYSKCLVEGRSLGPVVCFGWYFSNGSTHIAVGRHDGSVQLYLINMENLADNPRLKYTYFCGEPITSINGGCVGSEEFEILVATFSGRIFALRSGQSAVAAALSKIPQETFAARRAKLEAEVARLEKQTANEREKYQRSTRSTNNSSLSTPPLLDLQYEVSGASKDGWQEVTVMSAVPLDMLFIYSSKKLEMLTDTAAVLSICSSQGKASDLLATVRCQAGTRRLWVRMRNAHTYSIPEAVLVHIYALPAGAPRIARLITIRLPALPCYSKHEDIECENQTRPWCQLSLTGGFSVAEITSWLTEALPGDLPRPASNIAFARSHALLGTMLICKYQRGLALFKTDNVSTAAAMRSIVSNCAVIKGIRVEITCDAPDNCSIKSFELLEPHFKLEYQKCKDLALKKAISALDLDANSFNSDNAVLCDDYMHIWESSDQETDESHFDELVETVIQWNVDWHALSLHGDNFSTENGVLRMALKDCNIKEINHILSNNSTSPFPNEF